MAYDPAIVAIVKNAADTNGVPEELALGVTQAESDFDPNARSGANAWGLMQVLPATADWMLGRPQGTTQGAELLDPSFNANVGTRYLAWLLKRYGGDAQKTAAAYDWGPGNVSPSLPFDESRPGVRGSSMPSETRLYWQRVLNFAKGWAGKLSAAEVAVANTGAAIATAFTDEGAALGWTDQDTGDVTGQGKTAIILGGIGLGLIALLLWRRR